MATISNADKQNLTQEQQAQILALKEQYDAAVTQAEKDNIHAQAEQIRASAGYSGGAAGNAYVAQPASNTVVNETPTNNTGGSLGASDSAFLTAEQQRQIALLKDQWAAAYAANDQAGMDAAHQAAEKIRASAGYTAGTAGNGYRVLSANNGGMTADQMKAWIDNKKETYFDPQRGWTNGYSTAMNVRDKRNRIAQLMQANSDAWHTADEATRKYLHEQNLALAKLLPADKDTWYDEKTGKWYTLNRNEGYGEEVYSPEYIDDSKTYYGYTDEQLKHWATDPSIYYNFVDTRAGSRGVRDESTGFTGEYAQFLNGPYAHLSHYGDRLNSNELFTNVLGDGFYDEEDLAMMFGTKPQYDADGNPILVPDRLKNNNGLDDYSRQFADYTLYGMIIPGVGSTIKALSDEAIKSGTAIKESDLPRRVESSVPTYTPATGSAQTTEDARDGQLEYYENYGKYSTLGGYGNTSGSAAGSSVSGGTYEDYIRQMYDAALQAQLENLKSSYEQNISELDASVGKVDDTYTEQKRQTAGTSAQQAANWRELANAYGLNSGAIGQAALAQNNQLQSNLNTLEAAQAAAQAEIERQRTLLGQQYQLQINQAIAENNMSKAEMLYQEAVRADEALRQQQQFNANMLLQYAQMGMQQKQWEDELALSYAKAAQSGSGSGGVGGYATAPAEPEEVTPFDTNALYEAMYQSGARNYDDALYFLTNKYNQAEYGYGSNEEFIGSAANRFVDWVSNKEKTPYSAPTLNSGMPQSEFNTLVETVRRLKNNGQGGMLDSLLANYADVLSDAQYAELLMELRKAMVT